MTVDQAECLSGYVWHPMPEEVRRMSITERRASLAAARRKSQAEEEPVEAAAVAAAPVAAAPCEEQQQQQQEEQHEEEAAAAPAPEEEEPQEQHEEEAAPAEEEPAAAEEQHEEEPAAAEEEPQQEPEPEACVQAAVQQPTTTGTKRRSKTKHTVHFRGPRWGQLLKSDRKGLEAAFKKDVHAATGLDEARMESIEFHYDKVLSTTFIVRHGAEDDETQRLHTKLQDWKFPSTTALYPKS